MMRDWLLGLAWLAVAVEPFTLTTDTLVQPGYDPDREWKPMQDRVLSFDLTRAPGSGPLHCLAVLDGHGKKGHDCADLLVEALPRWLQTSLSESERGGAADIPRVLIESFHGADEELRLCDSVNSRTSGATCVMAVIGDGRIVCAKVGDSRAVVARRSRRSRRSRTGDSEGSEEPAWEALALSQDTTARRPEERARIEENRGRVDGQFNVWAGPVGAPLSPLPSLHLSPSSIHKHRTHNTKSKSHDAKACLAGGHCHDASTRRSRAAALRSHRHS